MSEMSFEIDEDGERGIQARILGNRPRTQAAVFDDYFLMLNLGLAAGYQTSKDNCGESRVFYQPNSPPGAYTKSWNSIIGLVIVNSLREEAIDFENKEEMNSEIQKLIGEDLEEPFTDDFWEAINGYARTGAKIILDMASDKMQWEEFLHFSYLAVIDELQEEKHKNLPFKIE